jgi:hypothetical protein
MSWRVQDMHEPTRLPKNGMRSKSAICIHLDGLNAHAKIVRQQHSNSLGTVNIYLTVRVDGADSNQAMPQGYTHRSPASVHNAWYLNLDYLPQENRGLIFRDAL